MYFHTDAAPQFLTGSINGDAYIQHNIFPHFNESPWSLTVAGDVSLTHNNFTNIPSNGLNFMIKERINIEQNHIHHLQKYAFLMIQPQGTYKLDMPSLKCHIDF